jgi:hypothetical protein
MVMPKTKKPTAEGKTATDKYNPGNMAQKKTGLPENQEPDTKPSADEYNPGNMAGKKAQTSKQQSE